MIKNKKFLFSIVLLGMMVVMSSGPALAASDPLRNGNFESGEDDWSTIEGSSYNGIYVVDYTYRSYSHSMYMYYITGNAPYIRQTVSYDTDAITSMSFYFRRGQEDPIAVAMFARYTGSSTEDGIAACTHSQDDDGNQNVWKKCSASMSALDDNKYLQYIIIRSVNAIYLDDVVITESSGGGGGGGGCGPVLCQ